MPANSSQSVAAFYLLYGDGRLLGAIRNPRFQTATLMTVQITWDMVSLFADNVRLPFHNVSLVMVDTRFNDLCGIHGVMLASHKSTFPR